MEKETTLLWRIDTYQSLSQRIAESKGQSSAACPPQQLPPAAEHEEGEGRREGERRREGGRKE